MTRSPSKRSFAKKLGTYSSLAAASVGGFAGQAQATPIIYDTQNIPDRIDAHADYFYYGINMAVIDPTTLTSSKGSAGNTQGLPVVSAAAAGLLGLLVNNGNYTDGIQTPAAPASPSTSSAYFRYQIFNDEAGNDKEGTQFGVRVAAGNGVYGFVDGSSSQPTQFVENDIIGDGDTLLTTDTNPSPTSLVGGIDTDVDGYGAGANFSAWHIVTGIKYLGFTINDRNGFVKVNKGGTDRNQIRILGWGLESDPFVPIAATLDVPGVLVPEPTTLGLLCLGAAGLGAYRVLRRKRRSD